MDDTNIVQRIIDAVSNSFEMLVYVSASLAVLSLIVYAAVKLHYVPKRKFFHSVFRQILSVILICGQLILIVVLVRLYWINYKKPAPELHISSKMSARTFWVKEDLRIHFIEGNVLRSIKVNGREEQEVFVSADPIKEYHFSPDGRAMLVQTQKELFLLDLMTGESRKIDGLVLTDEDQGTRSPVKGSITGIAWSPDSRKFIYEIARWSEFSSQDHVYIYWIEEHLKKSVQSPTRRISSLYWGKDSRSLYFLRHEAQSGSVNPSAYEVRVFQIPLNTLIPEVVTQISYEQATVPIENLNLRGIELFLEGEKLSFGGSARHEYFVSSRGSTIGIDDDDYLFFISAKWFRKRLFKVPRELRVTEIPRHQYQGGDLVIEDMRWLPGGRYVIMEHRYWGVLILEPSTGKIGLLIQAHGRAFGWYQGTGN